MVESGNDPKEVEADLHDSLKLLGYYLGELENRTSAYNRFANGAKDTVASAYAGAGNVIGALTGGALGDESPNTDDISDMVEKDMDETAKADSKLYKSLNIVGKSDYFTTLDTLASQKGQLEQSTEMATTIGQEAPAFVLGGAGSAIPKTALAMESGLELAKGFSETKEFSPFSLLAPAVGYGLAKMFANKIGRTFDNIKEYEDAVRAEPRLEKELDAMFKAKVGDKKLQKEILDGLDAEGSNITKGEPGYELSEELKAVSKQMKSDDPIGTKKMLNSQKEFSEGVDEHNLATQVRVFGKNQLNKHNLDESEILGQMFQFVNDKKGKAKLADMFKDQASKDGKFNRAYKKLIDDFKGISEEDIISLADEWQKAAGHVKVSSEILPVSISAMSKTPKEFIDNVVKFKDIMPTEYKALVRWAENVQHLDPAGQLSALEKLGMNASTSILTGVPFINKFLPNFVNKGMSKGYNAVATPVKRLLTQPIGYAKEKL
jgi:hypothetical protein